MFGTGFTLTCTVNGRTFYRQRLNSNEAEETRISRMISGMVHNASKVIKERHGKGCEYWNKAVMQHILENKSFFWWSKWFLAFYTVVCVCVCAMMTPLLNTVHTVLSIVMIGDYCDSWLRNPRNYLLTETYLFIWRNFLINRYNLF